LPLRDHFRLPVSARSSWEGFHGMWPAVMVQRVAPRLPAEFTAEPRVHLGSNLPFVDADLAEQYEYEVLVYDQSRSRCLVAAVEIVSPANKDRPGNRRALVTKCAALLQQGVCVSVVDLVTTRQFNLYADLLSLLNRPDPAFAPEPPPVYAATCRCRRIGEAPKLETWAYPLAVGRRLPDLPIWLSADLHVLLELEAGYEETCRVLRIP
jgi:hypothetical protein